MWKIIYNEPLLQVVTNDVVIKELSYKRQFISRLSKFFILAYQKVIFFYLIYLVTLKLHTTSYYSFYYTSY